MSYGWDPYVSAAQKQAKIRKEIEKLKKKGYVVSPVNIEGRTIAKTFWGKAWCDNLERYGDYENRVPRGRTYVRNGSVFDLQIAPGEVKAMVGGSHIYQVQVQVAEVPKDLWTAICRDCAGAIDSLVELLQGRFSKGVMERICMVKTGLFPSPKEIRFSCSCPDWAGMCKHIAAVLYGIGARLDNQPELLFKLRRVNEKELIATAGAGMSLSVHAPSADKILGADGLSELFGLDMGDVSAAEAAPKKASVPARAKSAAKTAKKTVPKPEEKPSPKTPAKPVKKTASPEKGKAVEKPEKKAPVKPAGKSAVKANTKTAAKPEEKSPAKSKSKAAAKTEAKPAPKPKPPEVRPPTPILPGAGKEPKVKAGQAFTATYKKKTYRITIYKNGVECEGRLYASLDRVVDKIAGKGQGKVLRLLAAWKPAQD